MTDKVPPDWILIEAAKRCGREGTSSQVILDRWYSDATLRALCDMIERYEQPPVDRKVLCAREAMAGTVLFDPVAIEGIVSRAIEQHEQFKREVSDAVERAVDDCGHDGLRKAYIHSRFFHFIISKPDPLVEAMSEALTRRHIVPSNEVLADEAAWLRAALAARGLEIREVGHD